MKAKDTRLDLATLIFDKIMLEKMKFPNRKEFGSILIKDIYRDEIKPRQFVCIGGFPGEWRKEDSNGLLSSSC